MPKIHLFGDSITRGFALYEFEPSVGHVLYNVHSPWQFIAYLFTLNNITGYTIPWYTSWIVGTTTPPTATTIVADNLAAIVAGDVVVFEDAGPNGMDPVTYGAILTAAVDLALTKSPAKVILLTTPDYAGSAASADSRFDFPYAGQTTNDAIRAVAAAKAAAGATSVVLMEWDVESDRDKDWLRNEHDISEFPDGVHPGVWSQMTLVRLILDAAGLMPRIRHLTPLSELVALYYTSLAYGSGLLNADRARQIALRMMGVEGESYDAHLLGSLVLEGDVDAGPAAAFGTLQTVAPNHHVVLGGLGLMLHHGGWQRVMRQKFATPLRTAAPAAGGRLGEQAVEITDWQAGEGATRHLQTAPGQFRRGSNIDISDQGAISLGPHMALTQATVFNAITCLHVYRGALMAGTSTGRVYRWSGSAWELSRDTAKAGGITCMITHRGFLLVGNGTDGVIEYWDGATLTTNWATWATVPSDASTDIGTVIGVHAMASHRLGDLDHLWFAANGSVGRVFVGHPAPTGGGGYPVPPGAIAVAGYMIDESFAYVLTVVGAELFFLACTPFGERTRIFTVNNAAVGTQTLAYRGLRNGVWFRSWTMHQDVIYLGSGNNGEIWSWTGGRLQIHHRIGTPDAPYTHEIRALTSWRGALWVAVKEASTLGVLTNNGNDTFTKPISGVTGTTPDALVPFLDDLYLAASVTAASRLFQTNDTYAAAGEVETGLIDGGLPGENKLWVEAEVSHTALVTGQSVELRYQAEDTGAWTSLGSSATVGATSAAFSFPLNFEAALLGLKALLVGPAGGATPLKVYDLTLRYRPMRMAGREWSLTVHLLGKMGEPMPLRNGAMEALSGEQLSAALWAMLEDDEPITFLDIDRERVYTVQVVDYSEGLAGAKPAQLAASELGWELDGRLKLQEV